MTQNLYVVTGGKKEGVEEHEAIISLCSEAHEHYHFKHGDIVKLTHFGKCVYREVRFGNVQKNRVLVRHATAYSLDIDEDDNVAEIKPVKGLAKVLYLWHSPYPSVWIGVRALLAICLATWLFLTVLIVRL